MEPAGLTVYGEYRTGERRRPVAVSGYQGRRYEERCYRCNKCGWRNVVARCTYVGGRVQIAPGWRGKCVCGVYLGWMEKGFRKGG